MKSFKSRLSFLLPIFLVLFFSTSSLAWQGITGGRGNFNTDPAFSLLYGGAGTNVFGDFVATGNSILISDNPSDADLITDTTTYKSVDASFINNTYSLGDSEKMNSSSADLTLPSYVAGSDIVWAGLFWQGHVNRDSGAYTDAGIDADAANWNRVTIKDSLGVMHPITAPLASDDTTHKAFFHTVTDQSTGYRHHYGAYHDVTAIVKNSYSSANKTFTVGNIKTTAGNDAGNYVYISQAPAFSGNFNFGLYGGWSLIVVYNVSGSVALAQSVAPKNVSIYDGFDLFLTWGSDTVPFQTTIDLGGFYTPKTGAVNSKLLLFGGAGDRNIENDTLQIQDKNNVGVYSDLTNGENDIGEQFNHTYTNMGVHMTPSDENKQGMDLDIYNISSSMTNEQTSTKIKFGVVKSGAGLGGSCDQIFPQVIGFSTELYEPQFCYDYAYEQNDVDFTEPNDGTQDPTIDGSGLVIGDPIKLKIFIKNMESDLAVTNVSIDIQDINNTATTYVSESVRVANVGEALPTSIPDASLTETTTVPAPGFTTVEGIPLNDVNPADYFYIYYDLNPQNTVVDTPINLMFNFTISPSGIDTEYHYPLGSKIPLCKNTSFAYEPANGLFNVVHDAYYSTGAGDKYYNLPTQVVQRAGDFNVISLDYPDNPDDLIVQTTVAAVDIIDNSGFHYTDASCTELESAITGRVWVIFDGTTFVPFDSSVASSTFYTNAVENGAFRVSYSVDNNGSLQELSGSNNNWTLANFPTFAATDNCVAGSGVSDSINDNCNDGAMTNNELKTCMECMYGLKTKLVCSKDNFSIRPEAFMIKLKDKDQNNTATPDVAILNNVSGVVTPDASTNINDLSAGYQYDLNITATDHTSNSASPGYIKSFGASPTQDIIQYQWTPGATIVTECNDISDVNLSNTISNGSLDINTSLPNVGIYRLHVEDTTWTTVDSDATFMTHHTGPNFANTLDCAANSDVTVIYGSLTKVVRNGCDISSSHSNSFAVASNLKYQDYNLEFHPHRFNMDNINITRGIENNSTFNANTFIYMNDMELTNAQDQNMSLHLNGSISAVGYDGNTTSNFVNNCFAKPVTLTINRSARPAGVTTDLKFRYINTDKTVAAVNQWHNNPANASSFMNNAVNNIPLNTDDFNQSQGGVTNSILNINMDRNSSTALNPERITFIDYRANCFVPANCSMIAGTDPINGTILGSTRNTTATLDTNQSVTPGNSINMTFLYGRTHASRQRYEAPAVGAATGTANIYYESYCFGTINGQSCTPSVKALLPQGINSIRTDDIRWYANTSHTTNEGRAGTTTQINAGVDVTGTLADGNITATTPITSNQSTITYVNAATKGYPYTTTMENTASRWLIYDQRNINATTNKFSVEFYKKSAGWSGLSGTSVNTKDQNATISNRRSQW